MNALYVTESVHELVVTVGAVTHQLYVTGSPVVEILEVGAQGPAGPPGPMSEVADDLSPSLGGDLELGAFNIIGTLENTTFVVDGGLL